MINWMYIHTGKSSWVGYDLSLTDSAVQYLINFYFWYGEARDFKEVS